MDKVEFVHQFGDEYRCTSIGDLSGEYVKATDAEALRECLRAAIPPDDDWWCPVCQTGLHGSRVTNDERCDTCGTYLGYQTSEWVERARELTKEG